MVSASSGERGFLALDRGGGGLYRIILKLHHYLGWDGCLGFPDLEKRIKRPLQTGVVKVPKGLQKSFFNLAIYLI